MKPQIITAIPIPFTASGELDTATYRRAVEYIEPHVDAILVAGTTGEFLALDDDERLELFRLTGDIIGADRTIAHLGHASAFQAARLAQRTRDLGISRTALITPYYLPTDEAGLVEFYRRVLAATEEASLYAYLFPERTGLPAASAQVVQEIFELPGIAGVKLSGAANDALAAYLDVLPAGQELYSGNDATLPQVMAAGGHGVVSGVSSVFPEVFADLAGKIHRDEDYQTVQDTAARLVALTGPNIRFLKVGLAARIGGEWDSRMSMPTPTEEEVREIQRAVAEN